MIDSPQPTQVTGASPTVVSSVGRVNPTSPLTIPQDSTNVKGVNPANGVKLIWCMGKKYSRNQIAAGAGIDRPLVTKIFKGQRPPSLKIALRMAAFMQCSVEHLIGVVIPTNVTFEPLSKRK